MLKPRTVELKNGRIDLGGVREGSKKFCYGWAGIGPMKMVYNGKTESKNPREGVGGLNKGAHQNAALFLLKRGPFVGTHNSVFSRFLVPRWNFFFRLESRREGVSISLSVDQKHPYFILKYKSLIFSNARADIYYI